MTYWIRSLQYGRGIPDEIDRRILAAWFSGVHLAVLHWRQGSRNLIGAGIAGGRLEMVRVNYNMLHN